MKPFSSPNQQKTSKTVNQPIDIMKSPKFLSGLLAVALAVPAMGATYEITGATAFRAATITSIHALYVASGQAFRFSHNGATEAGYTGADVVTFEGTITGLPGTTVVRCSFNGSIEGLRALAQPGQTGVDGTNGDPSFLKLSTAQTETAIVGGRNIENVANSGANIERARAEMAFSDTDKAISPYAADDMVGASPGLCVFGLVVSEGGSAITNVTANQFNALLGNGFTRMSQFTGDSAHDNRYVFATGRNDGSGTRSSYLAEMGYGVSNTVNQYLVISNNGDEITAIQRVPAGGVNDSDPNTAGIQLPAGPLKDWQTAGNVVTQDTRSASTVWGQDVNGNGGGFSGSTLRGNLARKGTSVRVFTATGGNTFGSTPLANIALVTWLSLNDAKTAVAGGATLASFDGVGLTFTGGDMTESDKTKIYNGQYTAWNFQQFYHRLDQDTDTKALYDLIFNAIPANLATAGLQNADMKVGRGTDGGVINPIF